MRGLIDFYRAQIRLLWQWRGGRLALARRLVITLLVSAVAFQATDWLLDGLTVQSFGSAVLAVLLMAGFNAIVRPLVLLLIAPRSIVLTAVAVLVLQVVAFFVVAQSAPGVAVFSLPVAVIASFVYALIDTSLTAILGIDTGGSYFGKLVQMMQVGQGGPKPDTPGVVIVQIDGLAYPVLAGRIRAGSVPTLAGWLRDGSHRLSRWEALLPSMTSASQLGILHGTNDGVPAFRWYERDREHLMVSGRPADAAEMVRRASNGHGLLSNDGVSICNLVTGDATRSYFTTAALAGGARSLGDSRAFVGFFLSPTGYLRSIWMFIGEFVKERVQYRRTRRSGIAPQLHRDLKYAGMRAASNVILRDLNVSLVIEEMYRGANVIYVDFTDYDEIAHHSGPERLEALQALDGVDAAIGTILKAAEDSPRPYRFVVLSDHGQSLGATFAQRYGESLGDLVLRLTEGRATVDESATAGEGSTFVNAFLSEVTRSNGVGPTVARVALGEQTHDGVVDLDADRDRHEPTASVVVVGSGNLGLVYFTGFDHRLTLEELETLHPNLVGTLASHPGVALVLARSETRGGIAFGARGLRYLDDGRVEGEDPTALFGPNTLTSLRREDAMRHAPDLLLLSQYEPVLGEVAAFEELIGSHGGLGGPQTEAFVIHPADWELDEPLPLGAPAVHRNLRRWLGSIGIALDADGDGATRDGVIGRPGGAADVGVGAATETRT